MSKKVQDRRQQPEFFFVFRGDADQSKSKSMSEDRPNHSSPISEDRPKSSSPISEDEAKTHRDKLLDELREFGC